MKNEFVYTACSLRGRGMRKSQNWALERGIVSKFGRKHWQNDGQGTKTDDQGAEFLTPQHCHLRPN